MIFFGRTDFLATKQSVICLQMFCRDVWASFRRIRTHLDLILSVTNTTKFIVLADLLIDLAEQWAIVIMNPRLVIRTF